ncbi:hypothetical protein [Pseudooceanicola aestuarii]|uniref:hypothetical protein n=1 Tax=Pseudooceanicola aestuarii TaxID=2697319 RepID=UPI0013D3D023|nr:hypothetical protein [Pseudooceanicola aestuarii]
MTLTVTLAALRYNAACASFEAMATVEDAGATYRYPVSVMTDLDADQAEISVRLSAAARMTHHCGASLRSRSSMDQPVDKVPQACIASARQVWTPELYHAA